MKRNKILLAVTCLSTVGLLTGCIDYFASNTTPIVTPSPTPIIHNDLDKVTLSSTYQNYVDNNAAPISNCPLEGNVKLLVIPVWFTDSSSYISSSKKASVRSDIQKAYFGSESETGWHSVKTYYETESQDRLTLSGTVSSWYECGESHDSFGYEGTGDLVESAVSWYFSSTGESRKSYDSDNNGYLDGVMLIYAAPDYQVLNNDYSNLWAYCFWIQDSSLKNRANPGPNVFFWASYDFMYGDNVRSKTGYNYGNGNTDHCTIDTHTYIHEMGHVFGLEDYYDYGDTQYSPAGDLTMQDANVGGHDPFSIMALGWADPYIPQNSCSITIGSFQSTHDLILLTPSFNRFYSPFDEYILLELYTATGLNAFDSNYSYFGQAKYKLPKAFGIRIWHIDARLLYISNNNVRNGQLVNMSIRQITTDPDYNSTYGVTMAFSNTYNDPSYGSCLGEDYYDYNLLQLIRNDTLTSHHTQEAFSSSDLFLAGSSFSLNKYSRQFVNGSKMNGGDSFGWEVSVKTCTSSSATIELTRQ